MEVILREHVDNLGRRGEVVKVASGYARNYRLPRKLALPATPGNKKHVDRERKILESREAEDKAQAETVAAEPQVPRAPRARTASSGVRCSVVARSASSAQTRSTTSTTRTRSS